MQNFIIKNNLVYKKNRTDNTKLLKVIQRHKMELVLYIFHNDPTAGYFLTDKMFDKIKSHYYWPQIYNNIKLYAQSCDNYQQRGKYKRIEPLHPISVYKFFYQIEINIVRPLPRTSQENRYIV